MHNLEKDNWL